MVPHAASLKSAQLTSRVERHASRVEVLTRVINRFSESREYHIRLDAFSPC